MASSRSRSRGGASSSRPSKAKSRKSAAPAAAEVEVVEEAGGLTIDDGIPILTTILLLVAFVLVDYVLGTDYGAGMFFK